MAEFKDNDNIDLTSNNAKSPDYSDNDFSIITDPDTRKPSSGFPVFVVDSPTLQNQNSESLQTAYCCLRDANTVIQKKLVDAENKIKTLSKHLAESKKSRQSLIQEVSIMTTQQNQEVNALKNEISRIAEQMKSALKHGLNQETYDRIVNQLEELSSNGTVVSQNKTDIVDSGFDTPVLLPKVAEKEKHTSQGETEQELKAKIRNYESDLLLRKQESDIVHQQLNSLQNELPRLRKRIDALRGELKTEKESHAQQKDGDAKKIAQMEIQIKELEDINKQLTMRVKNLTTQLNELDEMIVKEQREKDDYKKRYLKLGFEMEDKEEEYKWKIKTLEKELAANRKTSLTNVSGSDFKKKYEKLAFEFHDMEEEYKWRVTKLETELANIKSVDDRPSIEPVVRSKLGDRNVDGDSCVDNEVMQDVLEITTEMSKAKQQLDEQVQILRTLMKQVGQSTTFPKPLQDDRPLSMPMQEVDQHGGPTVYPPDPVSLNLQKNDEQKTEITVDKLVMEAAVKPLSDLNIKYPPSGNTDQQHSQLTRFDENEQDIYGEGRGYNKEGGVPQYIPDEYAFQPRPSQLVPRQFDYDCSMNEISDTVEFSVLSKPPSDGIGVDSELSQTGLYQTDENDEKLHNIGFDPANPVENIPANLFADIDDNSLATLRYAGGNDISPPNQNELWRNETQPNITESGGNAPRECPVCYALFPHTVSMNDFSHHVNDHFEDETFAIVNPPVL
ncbi:uncharacterized protein LOC102804567 [Saccoglossus kowalevskii]|uniref:Early endosome antigen 1-like n=1 Tax=Saccoglossus kowalevskii TaxID=10224 RepID=A0ABM0LW27_SACKO|nr:PREDICTED: early endosome antigen 1-like [Saccoglossus kowalevskii]